MEQMMVLMNSATVRDKWNEMTVLRKWLAFQFKSLTEVKRMKGRTRRRKGRRKRRFWRDRVSLKRDKETSRNTLCTFHPFFHSSITLFHAIQSLLSFSATATSDTCKLAFVNIQALLLCCWWWSGSHKVIQVHGLRYLTIACVWEKIKRNRKRRVPEYCAVRTKEIMKAEGKANDRGEKKSKVYQMSHWEGVRWSNSSSPPPLPSWNTTLIS